MQISMNVRVITLTTVMRMHSALTQMGVSSAPATLATLEMESTVQVSSLYIVSYMHFICTFIHSADINECELEIDPCNSNANCTDTDGSFSCTCKEGFEGDGLNCTGIIISILQSKHNSTQNYVMCWMVLQHLVADIPECERGLDDCDPNATCINTIGSYDCMCNMGFTGDGFTCTG